MAALSFSKSNMFVKSQHTRFAIENRRERKKCECNVCCRCVCVPRIQCTLIPGNVIIHTRMFRCFRLFFWHRFDMLIKIRHKILISCTHSTFFSLSRARVLNFFVCNFFQRYCCWCRCQCRQYRTSSLHRTLFAIRSIHFSWIPEIFIFRCSIYKYNAKKTTTATSRTERMKQPQRTHWQWLGKEEVEEQRRRNNKMKRNRIMRRAPS